MTIRHLNIIKNCRLGEYVERHNINMTYSLILKPLPLNVNTCHIYVGFTLVIYSRNLGINTCAVDMLNALPAGRKKILLIAHRLDYGCRFILEYLQNAKPIMKSV